MSVSALGSLPLVSAGGSYVALTVMAEPDTLVELPGQDFLHSEQCWDLCIVPKVIDLDRTVNLARRRPRTETHSFLGREPPRKERGAWWQQLRSGHGARFLMTF